LVVEGIDPFKNDFLGKTPTQNSNLASGVFNPFKEQNNTLNK